MSTDRLMPKLARRRRRAAASRFPLGVSPKPLPWVKPTPVLICFWLGIVERCVVQTLDEGDCVESERIGFSCGCTFDPQLGCWRVSCRSHVGGAR